VKITTHQLLTVVLTGLLVSTLSACGSGTTATRAPDTGSPQLIMMDSRNGFAVWPSGVRWILLQTTDGWKTAVNRTPTAVPTDGGLILAVGKSKVAVGVLPHEQLTVSPVLESTENKQVWIPTQLPGALLPAAGALALSDSAAWAIEEGSDSIILTRPTNSNSWRHATSARELDPAGLTTVDGINFLDPTTGFITATSRSGKTALFVSTTAGMSWQTAGLSVNSSKPTKALPPCKLNSTWVAPVVSGDTLVVFTSKTPKGPWLAGPGLPVGASPAVGCGAGGVWVATSNGATADLFVSSFGGSWTPHGSSGIRIASLSVTGRTTAIALSPSPAGLFTIDLTTSIAVAPLPLPDWVDTIGGPEMRS
jgi:hypothetical protein